MKVGIFSDIHGNIYAFKKVWEKLKQESCDLYLMLGDICGYYYYQNEIIDILRNIENIVCVRGNHDDLFLKILKDAGLEKEYATQYGKSCSILKNSISKENLEFIQNMSNHYILEDINAVLFHGSPWDYMNGYVYPDSSLKQFGDIVFSFVFLGHTHYPMHKILNGKHIVNPGSCGQPRDFNLASYAIFDSDKQECSIKRIAYDVELMVGDVRKNKEVNPYLEEVLMRN